jgi:hypothetical protein
VSAIGTGHDRRRGAEHDGRAHRQQSDDRDLDGIRRAWPSWSCCRRIR